MARLYPILFNKITLLRPSSKNQLLISLTVINCDIIGEVLKMIKMSTCYISMNSNVEFRQIRLKTSTFRFVSHVYHA